MFYYHISRVWIFLKASLALVVAHSDYCYLLLFDMLCLFLSRRGCYISITALQAPNYCFFVLVFFFFVAMHQARWSAFHLIFCGILFCTTKSSRCIYMQVCMPLIFEDVVGGFISISANIRRQQAILKQIFRYGYL